MPVSEEGSVGGRVKTKKFREVSRTRSVQVTGYSICSMKAKVVVLGCRENTSCRKVLNFLERLDDRTGCTHEETVAVVEPGEAVGSNKSLGCVFNEKPAEPALCTFPLCSSSLTAHEHLNMGCLQY